MKYIFLIGFCMLVSSCKNPFSNDKSEGNQSSYTIENTEDDKILLRLRPEVGDKTLLQMDVKLQPEGMLVSLDTHFIGDLKLRVNHADEINNQYTIDFQRIQFETAVLGTKIKYDSQSDNNNLPQQMQNEIQSLLANKVEMSLDSLAHIKSISFNQKSTDLTTQSIDLNSLFIPLPAKAVQVGDSWSVSQDVQNLKNIELVYTIKKISATEVMVAVASIEEEVIGQYLIDRKTGFTKKAQLNINSIQNGKGLKMLINLKIQPTT